MWKNNKRLKKVTIAFTDDYLLKDMAEDLRILNDLEIIDYKVNGENSFSVSFSKKFVEYYNVHHDQLQVRSLGNMMGAIQQFPEEFEIGKKPSTEQFVNMFYSTVILSYLTDTGLIKKIDPTNLQLLGRLIVTVQELQVMSYEK